MATTKVQNRIPSDVFVTDWRKAFHNYAYMSHVALSPQAKAYWYDKAKLMFDARP